MKNTYKHSLVALFGALVFAGCGGSTFDVGVPSNVTKDLTDANENKTLKDQVEVLEKKEQELSEKLKDAEVGSKKAQEYKTQLDEAKQLLEIANKKLQDAQKELQKLDPINDTPPVAGEFLKGFIGKNEKSKAIVKVYKGTTDANDVVRYEHKNYGEKTSQFETGLRENGILTNESGVITHFHHGFGRDYSNINKPQYNTIVKTAATKVEKLTSTSDNANSTLDPGLIEKGKFDGIYYGKTDIGELAYRDPAVAGWNYQTFGNFKVSGQIGENLQARDAYESIGVYTLANDLPTKGEATYNGITVGTISGANNLKTTANVKMVVDFASKSFNFNSTNTKTYQINASGGLDNGVDAQELNLNAQGLVGADGAFNSATIQTQNGFKGELKGNFYGPKAAEAGGVYGLQNENKSQTFIGGFGAKRP